MRQVRYYPDPQVGCPCQSVVAGHKSEGGGMDAANLVKLSLARGMLRCIVLPTSQSTQNIKADATDIVGLVFQSPRDMHTRSASATITFTDFTSPIGSGPTPTVDPEEPTSKLPATNTNEDEGPQPQLSPPRDITILPPLEKRSGPATPRRMFGFSGGGEDSTLVPLGGICDEDTDTSVLKPEPIPPSPLPLTLILYATTVIPKHGSATTVIRKGVSVSREYIR
ncbi:hypothetical protein PM082_011699 [Marasmius tenuissimus]|nr:hypothetical protein PM082_011699 [Marasmius tenuissimus]